MRIDVLDADTLARVGWVDVWVSFYWDSPYYSEGSFTLEVRPTAENLQLLQEGRWLVRSDETPNKRFFLNAQRERQDRPALPRTRDR